ncbi:MAG: folate family ECF transporter S component [Clostridiales bacterium]|nr:folate family ECF transporter S component [Clostridiales bacterium]
MKKTRTLVITSLLVSITVILSRFLPIFRNDVIRISIEFLPIALGSIIFGPLIGSLTGLLADIIGATLFPSGTFFPGFTLSAFLTGIIYGFFLYKKNITVIKTVMTVIIKIVIIDLVLVTTWLLIIYKMPLQAIIISRIIKCVIMVPIEILLIYYIANPIKNHLRKLNLQL